MLGGIGVEGVLADLLWDNRGTSVGPLDAGWGSGYRIYRSEFTKFGSFLFRFITPAKRTVTDRVSEDVMRSLF